MKRFLLMAVLIGAAGVLGACSKNKGTTTTPPPPPKTAAPASSTLKLMPAKPATAMTAAAPQTKKMAPSNMSSPKPATGGG